MVGARRLIIPFVARIAIVQWGLGNAADEPQHRGHALGHQSAEYAVADSLDAFGAARIGIHGPVVQYFLVPTWAKRVKLGLRQSTATRAYHDFPISDVLDE